MTPQSSAEGGAPAGRLRPLRVLVTASGAPGAARLIHSLQQNGERELRVIGTDMSDRRGGRVLCDSFHVVPPGSSDEYADTLVELAEREQVDVVFPLSSFEVAAVSEAVDRFPVPVLVASPEAIAACNDKSRTMELCARLGVPMPQSIRVTTPAEFRAAAEQLGYPEVDVCTKPTGTKGSRGFLVLSANTNRRWHVLDARPGPMPLTVDEALEAIGEEDFPTLLVMEYVKGEEHTVDAICRGGRFLLGHAKTREAVRAGLAMFFATCDRPDLVDASRAMCAELGVDWFVNVQFLGGRLLEINPRISTIVYQEDMGMPYLAVKLALGELDEEGLAAYNSRVRPTRRAIRYYDQVEYDDPA
ncbi:MAG TPA: ATP-grasp domain-containing protein [Thermoleophilia bacterium]|nr:ATP-grasp domain-containing protein [Thermoleophilia bacterium]